MTKLILILQYDVEKQRIIIYAELSVNNGGNEFQTDHG